MIKVASPILNLLLAKGVGTKTLSDIVDKLVARGLSPDDTGIDVLADELHWRAELRANVHSVQEQADLLAEQIERQNIRILVRGFDPYPQKLIRLLGKDAPPVLFAKGNLALMEAKAVGFCGSRHASAKGIHVAGESARQLGEKGINVVSGYAKGVDLTAHCAALDAGGTTTIVLAEGILHFNAKREIKALLNDVNYLVVSEYSPRLPWAARNAMQRNRTIIGLSDAMIVVESGTTGGTFACAEAALELQHPLFVVEYAVPAESAGGNQQFLSQGAQPLRGDRHGRPILTKVFDTLGTEPASEVKDEVRVAESRETRIEPPANTIETIPKPTTFTQPDENSVKQIGYPKRLIEVDLPIARISAHARREKSIRHGHISTLHIWWARRPLAACRAVICAALWPDPDDKLCPQAFRDAAAKSIKEFAKRFFPDRINAEKQQLHEGASAESLARWESIAAGTMALDAKESGDWWMLRMCLLDFIADFANWDNSTVPAYLETSRALTQVAHEALGGAQGTRPLVVDPFCGGGSIPLEALRVGADAFASDLNPVPVLLNKVVLEYIPKFGQRLADEVRKWGAWVRSEAEKELASFYPRDSDGSTPIAYIWARTIRCEGPGCGTEVPLIRSVWLAKKPNRSVSLRLSSNLKEKRVEFDIFVKQPEGWVSQVDSSIVIPPSSFIGDGTVKRGSATCPCCGYTTPVARVREQFNLRRGGANDARLLCVVTTRETEQGRFYRVPTDADFAAAREAEIELGRRKAVNIGSLSLVPDEPLPPRGGLGFRVQPYGMAVWGDIFNARQSLLLTTMSRLVRELEVKLSSSLQRDIADAVQTCLACGIDRQAEHATSLCRWNASGQKMQATFGRQAIPMMWDYCEASPFGESVGSWSSILECVLIPFETAQHVLPNAQTVLASAASHPLPDDIANAFITDPPYYDAIPYADLSDFFYVWLRRTLPTSMSASFSTELTPKADECIVDEAKGKDRKYYEQTMAKAMSEGRRILTPSGIGIVVFANKSTAGWETQLQAMIDAGWTITGSWPIDTEMGTRLRAMDSAALASSVHLVCRPREDESGVLVAAVGEWRDVLSELPKRIHEWMPRLALEGVVGADAIFACLGPALEIYSRYSRVEKANGEQATLREYLEFVWAAVSTEALSLIFKDADAAGLEPDARLTAMWLWTLGGGGGNKDEGGRVKDESEEEEEVTDDEDAPAKGGKMAGFTLEYDAARKIAQGLGVHLEQCQSLVEVKGDKARLLPVSERTKSLFGKTSESASGSGSRKKKEVQKSLFEQFDEVEATESSWSNIKGPTAGLTVLDRVHQSMIMFAAGRGELMKRFLVEEGIGKDPRFWKLAQSLSALYPRECEEKRWVDGVLARKKGLGL